MPVAISASAKQTNFNQLIKFFNAKCREFLSADPEEHSSLWNSELKQIAQRLFTLIPLELYDGLVFKVLEGFLKLSNSTSQKNQKSNGASTSKSRSFGSIGHKLRSLSLIQSSSDGPIANFVQSNIIIAQC
jgi:hypothetical protein